MYKVILDTNVVISALHKPNTDPALILSLALNGQLFICLTEEIFNEYQGVLARPKFSYLNPLKVEQLLLELKRQAHWLKPRKKVSVIKRDLADNMFLECALEAKADYIVTGNSRHFPKSFKKTRIVSPAEFMQVIANQMLFE